MRLAILLALALPTAGCALHSDKPLVTRNAPAPEIAEGTYQGYGPFGPEAAAKLSAAQRAQCLDLGIRAVPPNATNGAAVAVVHCPFNEESLAPTNVAQLRRLADRFQFTGPGAEGKPEAVDVWLEPLRAPYYVAQVGIRSDQLKGYFYTLARADAGRVLVFMVPCSTEGLKTVGAPEPKLKCEITSLAAIRPDLLAEIQRIDSGNAEPPMVLAPPPK